MSGLPPLIPGLADPAGPGSDCGGCEGIAIATPRASANRPGLPAVAYRPGRFADFRRSQLARLSSDDHPALAQLRSRENDDFTIALIDAWSCVCDVLTFYQERIANESWLGTATERLSVVELGRLIGYRPRPGVAAATALAFTIEDPPGAPAAVTAVSIPDRTRVQSIPGPGETAQTFETVETIEARIVWNALVPRQSRFAPPADDDRFAWLAGISTGLKVGDAIVIVGDDRMTHPESTLWAFRKLVAVTVDAAGDRTRVAWTPPLDALGPHGSPAAAGLRLLALRARASLFGWNAPHPKLLADATLAHFTPQKAADDWPFTIGDETIFLDSIQDGFVADSWVALTQPQAAAQLYRIEAAVDDGRADFAISARATQLKLDTDLNLASFGGTTYRKVSVYGKSEALAFAEAPILEPVMGDRIALASLVDALAQGRRLVVRGRRAQAAAVKPLKLAAIADPAETADLAAGTRVTLLGAPAATADPQFSIWHLRTPGGFEGLVEAEADDLLYVAADETSETIAETATLAGMERDDDTHAGLRLSAHLAAAFDRPTTRIHANVALATHGETTQEILGDGNGATPFQSFTLRQSPLTFVAAASETGVAATLEVRVNEVRWHEAPALYGRAATDRVFEVRTNDDSPASVQFGDGKSGARLPTGRNNVVATYRKGIGAAGNVAAGALTMALDRPLGLKDVVNPLAATGGADAETLGSARSNAPIGTLTLGRVVSLRNYEQFALGFAGIAKARADWVWDGGARRIVVTVAGPGGAALDPVSGGVLDSLGRALRSLGDPFVKVAVLNFRPAYFRLRGKLAILADYDPGLVLAGVDAALRDAFGFEHRGFERLVALSAVQAAIHSVAGVEAVDIDELHRVQGPGPVSGLHPRLLASASDGLVPAEILTLDAGPVGLELIG